MSFPEVKGRHEPARESQGLVAPDAVRNSYVLVVSTTDIFNKIAEHSGSWQGSVRRVTICLIG